MNKNKYQIGQKVYAVEYDGECANKETCKHCLGKGVYTIAETGEKVQCSYCGGDGYVITCKIMAAVLGKSTITSIIFFEETSQARYYIDFNNHKYIPESIIFLSKEEAQLKCDELNHMVKK